MGDDAQGVRRYLGRNPLIQAMRLPEATNMDDLKAGAREVKDDVKKTWREADGQEDLGDKVGNLGDDVRRNVGNAGDDVRRNVDNAGDDLDTELDKNRTNKP
jgi:hypothetical protein